MKKDRRRRHHHHHKVDDLIQQDDNTIRRRYHHHHHHHDGFTGDAEVVRDLSHYQTGLVNFAALKTQGIQGVILKASQGVGYHDPTFPTRSLRARHAGLLVGAYHFMDGTDPAQQMTNFVGYVGARATLFALDFEENPSSQATAEQVSAAAQWLLEQTGVRPIIYANANMFTASDPFLVTCGFWVVDWNPGPPVTEPGWPSWRLWQYASAQPTGGHSRWSGKAKDLAPWWANPVV